MVEGGRVDICILARASGTKREVLASEVWNSMPRTRSLFKQLLDATYARTPAMASSLSAVMEIPEIAAAITSCNEILPGMPASRANLKALLDHFAEDERGGSRDMVLTCEGPELLDGGTVTFRTFTRREKKQKKRFLHVFIDSAKEWASATKLPGLQNPPPYETGCSIDNKVFDHTEDGLIAALAWAKERAKHLKAENYCPSCRVDGPVLDQRPAGGLSAQRRNSRSPVLRFA